MFQTLNLVARHKIALSQSDTMSVFPLLPGYDYLAAFNIFSSQNLLRLSVVLVGVCQSIYYDQERRSGVDEEDKVILNHNSRYQKHKS